MIHRVAAISKGCHLSPKGMKADGQLRPWFRRNLLRAINRTLITDGVAPLRPLYGC